MAVLFIWKSMVKLLLFSQQRGILFLHFINIPQELSVQTVFYKQKKISLSKKLLYTT